MHELAKQVGLDLPEFLGKISENKPTDTNEKKEVLPTPKFNIKAPPNK